jgi:hypothetical protein
MGWRKGVRNQMPERPFGCPVQKHYWFLTPFPEKA